jgi:hypothetical protein
MTTDGRFPRGWTYENENYNRQGTIDLIQKFIDGGNVRYILYDDREVVNHFGNVHFSNGHNVVQLSPGDDHADHIHITFTGVPRNH